MAEKNYYEVLNISKGATEEEIKKAYFKMAKKYHPDVCKEKNSEELFKNVVLAYETLSHPIEKLKYDNSLKNKTNGVNKTNEVNKTNDFDYMNSGSWHSKLSELDSLLNSSQKNISYYVDFLNSNFLKLNEMLLAFSHFLSNFWLNPRCTISYLKNRTLLSMFEAFVNTNLFINSKNSFLATIYSHNSGKEALIERQEIFSELLSKISDYKVPTKSGVKWMTKLIVYKNALNDPNGNIFLILNKDYIKDIFLYFQKIYSFNKGLLESELKKEKIKENNLLSETLILIKEYMIFIKEYIKNIFTKFKKWIENEIK